MKVFLQVGAGPISKVEVPSRNKAQKLVKEHPDALNVRCVVEEDGKVIGRKNAGESHHITFLEKTPQVELPRLTVPPASYRVVRYTGERNELGIQKECIIELPNGKRYRMYRADAGRPLDLGKIRRERAKIST